MKRVENEFNEFRETKYDKEMISLFQKKCELEQLREAESLQLEHMKQKVLILTEQQRAWDAQQEKRRRETQHGAQSYQADAAVRIQSLWRGYSTRKKSTKSK